MGIRRKRSVPHVVSGRQRVHAAECVRAKDTGGGGNVTTIEGDPEGNIRDHKRRQDRVLDRANVACAFDLGRQLCASAYESTAIPVESLLWTLARLSAP